MEDDQTATCSYTRVLLSSSSDGENASINKQYRKTVLIKWWINLVCWVIFIPWAAVLIFFPLNSVQSLVQDWISLTEEATLFGSTGSFLAAFSGPALLLALLAALSISLSNDDDHYYEEYVRKKSSKNRPSYSLWTFPVLVGGAFGVVSGAELIGIVIFVSAVVFGVIAYTLESIHDVSSFQLPTILKWSVILEIWGGNLGYIGLFCLIFLFIPVARGSILLRLVDIPFEHATRYHVWLGHLTMLMFTLHGFSFVVAWAIEGNLSNLLSWQVSGSIAILPGVIALACGLLMWVTSIHLVRRKYFELFFYTHYLYIGFVVFLALHVGDFIFSVAMATILIFMLDRFLRFFQSRKVVDLISVNDYSCGIIELVISKPPNLKYNALSFIFVKASELSFLQWHPFSVSSSPMDGKSHLAVVVKVLGDWTTKLNDRVVQDIDQGELAQLCKSRIPLGVSVEGPYGHETPYYLMYKNLVLVAGGIGISPFLAILRDVLHRIKEGRPIFPNTILVVWAIKRSKELSLLPNLESICPSFSHLLNLEIQVYITQQSQPTVLEEGETYKSSSYSFCRSSKRCGISTLLGTGDRKWPSIYVSLPIIGFFVVLALVDEYYINRFDISDTWYMGLLLVACMAASVVIFGGLVATLWHLSARNVLVSEEKDLVGENGNMEHQHNLIQNKTMNIQYGCRPNINEILQALEVNWGGIDVGVIVCGPPSLESSVAKEIRSQGLRRRKHDPIFHFHSHSFEL